MPTPILATKLYLPTPRPNLVLRSRLIERLGNGLHQRQGFGRKLTLISAPAGFGKTTLASEWVSASQAQPQQSVAWLSLDEGDSDPTRFMAYLVAALQTVIPNIGLGALGLIEAPQPPSTQAILTNLLNEITCVQDSFVLVLDDYHLLDAKPVDEALIFLLEHMPPQMHLVITTREDPSLPLARYRAQGQLVEVRAADLRFTPAEAAEFLNHGMGLNLTATEIAALETRTEGWIAGLQMAAISMQEQPDAESFIQSFTGSHRFVMDYLVEEVLQRQSEEIQQFLLYTSLFDRLCGPLCDALLFDVPWRSGAHSGQATLEFLEQANLFIVPLDNDRHWYRYHHLFAELLRQRLAQRAGTITEDGPAQDKRVGVAALHTRASIWYEEQGLDLEAFHHAAAANDIDRATRLVEGDGMPLIFRGAAVPVLQWLVSLPQTDLDARPALWVIYASALLFVSRVTDVEEKLQAAERALAEPKFASALENGPDNEEAAKIRDLVGHIAAIRATLAVLQYDAETIVAQSLRALEHLHPDNLPVRTATTWALGVAYQIKGDRAEAGRAYTEAIEISQAIGHFIIHIMSTIGLGKVQETENQLHLAAESYASALRLAGDTPPAIVSDAYLGLARISYEWNDLNAAQQHAEEGAHLARQVGISDRTVASEIIIARLKLAQGDLAAAVAILMKATKSIHQHNFMLLLPEATAMQVRILLEQGKVADAAHLVEPHQLPLCQARVHLAQGKPSAALHVLKSFQQEVSAKGWADETLKVVVLLAIVYQELGEEERAMQWLGEALVLAEPERFIRTFVDEGLPMVGLLRCAAARGMMSGSVDKMLDALAANRPQDVEESDPTHGQSLNPQPLVEPLSARELEILSLIASGKTNQEIADQLIISLNTVRYHTKNLYGKLGVNKRTQAVAKAQDLGLI